jgi:hypothetical protein
MPGEPDRYEERLKKLGMKTLEERRDHLAMLKTHTILYGLGRVDRKRWFNMASEGQKATRQATSPWNIAARLDIIVQKLKVMREWGLPSEVTTSGI